MTADTVVEYRGVKNLVYAKVISDTENAYVTGPVKPFAGVATISATVASSVEAHYYDNAPKILIASSGAEEVTLTVSAIPLEVYADITGQTWDAVHGAVIEGPRTQDYFAIGYQFGRTDDSEIYVWRLKGMFSVPDTVSNTIDDGTDADGQEVTFTGVETTHKFTATGAGARAVAADSGLGLAKVSDWYSAVVTPDTIQTRV